jgi:hypothetical protein
VAHTCAHSGNPVKDIHVIKQAADANKKGRKKEHSAPEMCFQIGSAHSVQTVHGKNDGKYSKVIKPGIKLGMGTQASAANLNAERPVIEIASENDASSSEGSGESSDVLSYYDDLYALSASDEEEQSKELASCG